MTRMEQNREAVVPTNPRATPIRNRGNPAEHPTAAQAGITFKGDRGTANIETLDARMVVALNLAWDAMNQAQRDSFVLTSGDRPATREGARTIGVPTWTSQESVADRGRYFGRPSVYAQPGHSRHGDGLAVDIQPGLALDFIKANAARFGLYWPNIRNDPVHVQHESTRGRGEGRGGGRAGGRGGRGRGRGRADGGMVEGFAFGGEVDDSQRESIGQTFAGLVQTNPSAAAGAMAQNPAIFQSQAQIFGPSELSSMLSPVGHSRQPFEQNPPQPEDDKTRLVLEQPQAGLGAGYAEGGRVAQPKKKEKQKQSTYDFRKGGEGFFGFFENMPQSEHPPYRQQVEGIEGDLVFPQFTYTARDLEPAPSPDLRPPAERFDWRGVGEQTEGTWRNVPPAADLRTSPREVIREVPGFTAPAPVRQPPPAEGIYAQGGLVTLPGYYAAGGLGPSQMAAAAKQAHFSGTNIRPALKPPGVHLISSSVPGRTDRIPMRAPAGSFVIPADVVSGLGQGNTDAGAKLWGKAIASSIGPMGIQNAIRRRALRAPTLGMSGIGKTRGKGFAEGGNVDDLVPIVTAGGEALVDPEIVEAMGDGDPDRGKKELTKSVMRVRQQVIDHLKSLRKPIQ